MCTSSIDDEDMGCTLNGVRVLVSQPTFRCYSDVLCRRSSSRERATMGFLADWGLQTWNMLVESAPWLLGGFLLAGVIYVFAPVDRVVHHLGRPGLGPVLKASLFGIPLPLCSCSVIPVASSIRKQGASRGAFVSFMISTPETGVDSISISYALLGPLLAIVRPIAAFVTAVTAGLLISRMDEPEAEAANLEREVSTENCCYSAEATYPISTAGGKTPISTATVDPPIRAATVKERSDGDAATGSSSCCATTFTTREPPIRAATVKDRSDGDAATVASDCCSPVSVVEDDSCGCATSCCAEDSTTGETSNKVVTALRYGLIDMMTDLSPYLFAGFVLAGLAGAAIPEGFLERYIGSGFVAMLLMLVVGLPLYVCATSSTPVAAALIARGLSPGAALVFLLVGPATNIATMLVVSRDVGKRGLAIYLGTIAVVAVLFGLGIDALIPSLPVALAETPHSFGEHARPAAWPIAIVLALLILNGLRLRYTRNPEPCGCAD